jgi:hypothetical protein
VIRYRLEGVEYGSLGAVKEHVENEIGRIIDSGPLRLKPKDRLTVFDAIVKNHARLRALLSVEFSDDTEIQPDVRNILDMDV